MSREYLSQIALGCVVITLVTIDFGEYGLKKIKDVRSARHNALPLIFQKYDVNRDGVLSSGELEAMLKEYAVERRFFKNNLPERNSL